jgi:hypothetical protein
VPLRLDARIPDEEKIRHNDAWGEDSYVTTSAAHRVPEPRQHSWIGKLPQQTFVLGGFEGKPLVGVSHSGLLASTTGAGNCPNVDTRPIIFAQNESAVNAIFEK